MTRTSRPPLLVLVTAVVVGLLAASCTGSDKKSKTSAAALPSSPPTASGTSTAPVKPKPRPRPKGRQVNPFTGIGAVPSTPTIAVKIDDTASGRPQVGIDKADIVYIEEAEGGLTRLAAIFGTYHPTVGYVRSTRPSDPDLLLQFGKITEAYSGGAHDSLPRVRRSGITSWSNDAGARYYSRVNRYQSSYINLVLDLKQVAAHVRTPRPRDIGLRWSNALPGKGTGGTDVRTVVGGTAVEFRWYPSLKKYVRFINGSKQVAADGKPVATPNVVVQHCRIVPHPQDSDVLGNPSQFTYTVGAGKVSVFRNGRRFDGTWSRSNRGAPTRLIGRNKKTLRLSPGGAWFALVHRKARTTGT